MRNGRGTHPVSLVDYRQDKGNAVRSRSPTFFGMCQVQGSYTHISEVGDAMMSRMMDEQEGTRT